MKICKALKVPDTECCVFFLIYCMRTMNSVLREIKIQTLHLIGTAKEKGSYQRRWYNAHLKIRLLTTN